MDDTKKKRRWLSFSLKRLLLVVVVVAIAFGWLAVRLEKARRQQQSVAAVEKLGGQVMYEHQAENWDRPAGPEWLRNLIGRHFFDRAVRVDFTNRGIPNDDVTDVSCLSGLEHLRLLYLDRTSVRDIAQLASKKELWFLSLGYTQVEDFSSIAELQNLESLSLSRTAVSDLSPLRGLKLKRLWLDGTQVADISALKNMDGLVSLTLYKTLVEDISPLATAHQLESLSLNWTKVADIRPLMKLKKLQSLDLRRTSVTPESARLLSDALPKCQIEGP